MTARDRSRIETRKRLLDKGTELYSDRGVAETRATDIAQAAGVAVGTLYLHFGDKRGLLRAILFEGAEDLLESLRVFAEDPPQDVDEALLRHTEILVHFAEERPRLCQILFDPESVRTRVSTEITEYLVAMQEKRMREGIEKGFVSAELNPMVASRAVVGMFVYVLNWWTRNQDKVDRKTVVETLTRLRRLGLHQAEKESGS